MTMSPRIAGFVLLALLSGCTPADSPPRAGADADADADANAAGGADRDARGLPHDASPLGSSAEQRATILFLGTSLTAGYGIGAELAYPAVLQEKIDSAGLPFRTVNAGISGETSAGGLRRIDWMLQQPVDVLVIELGANDALRGLAPDALYDNLDAIIRRTRARYPAAAIVLAGMEAPPNLGTAYTDTFRAVYVRLAREHDAALIPFLLDGVAAEPALNLEDGIHPNEAGQRMLAANAWQILGPLLERRARGRTGQR
jgi:acyl-CoA thioesterase I